ncbi:spore germination protein GerW family protein [Actinoplanes sp. CA-051413]|uniref:spore germination protein GerW family protein n=1 Tax=Actinoplanes sp. CA-051413 TaxID=3239899 RepID=UPI003D97250D
MLDTLREAVGNVTVDKVFGTPITQGDTIVVPVARVGGGAGGGGGTGTTAPGQEQGGTGGGLGVSAKPLGVFVLHDGKVDWRPVIDVNRIVLGGQLVAVAALFVARALITARARQGARSRLPYRSAGRLARRVLPRR